MQTAQKIFEIVVTETGKELAQRRFFNRLNIRIQELIDKYTPESVLLDDVTGFKPLNTLNDPLPVRACWVNPIIYGIESWLNPEDAYIITKTTESEESAVLSAWHERNKDRQIKKRRRFWGHYVQE